MKPFPTNASPLYPLKTSNYLIFSGGIEVEHGLKTEMEEFKPRLRN